jgi:two-component system OmpR family response regulator
MARILVVEDDSETSDIIATTLREQGHDVVCLDDGRVALARLEAERFDVITLDRMLPGLDGLGLAARLRARRIQTPVLMLSALGDVDERVAGLRAGGDDYLAKPFAVSELAMRVEVLLRRNRNIPRMGSCAPDRSRSIWSSGRCGSAASRCNCSRPSSACWNFWPAMPDARLRGR